MKKGEKVEVVVKEVAKKGRPVNPNSKRQLRLKELDEKRKNGELKRGRPVNPTSKRQQRLIELEEKRKNGELKQGRPVNPNSKRQLRLAELEAPHLHQIFSLYSFQVIFVQILFQKAYPRLILL